MLSKTEKESTPEEVLDSIEKLQQHLKPCKNCTHGIRAEKPYVTLSNLKIPDPVNLKTLKEGTPEYHKALETRECRICIFIQALRMLPKEKQLAWIKEPNTELFNEDLKSD